MTTTHLFTTLESPIGQLLLVGDGQALQRLHMQDGRKRLKIDPRWEHAEEAFAEPCRQLREYFDGGRREFELALGLRGNEFELRVWDALLGIPYGDTASYSQIAEAIGQPGAARAVGVANARNPIAVIVPCHRVIGANGALTGYGGGLERKRLLLDLEAGVLSLTAATG